MTQLMLFMLVLVTQANGFDIICHYMNRAQYRPGKGEFHPENIDPNLCTHIVYAFAKPLNLEIIPTEANDETMFQCVMKLKEINPQLKILIAVGGPSTGYLPFIHIVETSINMQTFARNAVTFLRKNNFDGLDIDWEYPAAFDGASMERIKLTLLMEDLNQAFRRDEAITGKPRLLLSLSVAAKKSIIDNAYEVDKLINIVDFMNIVSYDYHGGWENITGFNSPLYGYPLEREESNSMNLNWTANYYVSLKAIKSKLNIGIASYGRSFTLQNANVHDLLSPTISDGHCGLFTRLPGLLAYYEVCDVISSGGNVVSVPSQGSSYVVKDNQWIGYDDVYSVIDKVCYAIRNGFRGVTFRSMDFDDFSGTSCNQGKYPLLSAIYNVQNQSDTMCSSSGQFVTAASMGNQDYDSDDDVKSDHFRVFCYYKPNANRRPGKGTFVPENIDPSLCTHISYAFGNITKDNVLEVNEESMFDRIGKLRKIEPKLKILITVGGHDVGSEPFEKILKSHDSLKKFSKNAVSVIRSINFDGLDVNWVYPKTKRYFKLLIQEIRHTIEDDAKENSLPPLLLVATVAADKDIIDSSYDVPSLIRHLDFLNVMSYDYHGSWENVVGFNSPLFAHPRETGNATYQNVVWTMRYYVTLGAPREKLNLGIASYGRSFIKRNISEHSIQSPSSGPGPAAPFTQVNGIMAYYEVCEFISSGAEVVYVHSQSNSYAHKNNIWVGYDDKESIRQKTCYSFENGYGGVTFWSLDYDDFLGTSCNQGKYPLLNSIRSVSKKMFSCVMYSVSSNAPRSSHICQIDEKVIFIEAIIIWSALSVTII